MSIIGARPSTFEELLPKQQVLMILRNFKLEVAGNSSPPGWNDCVDETLRQLARRVEDVMPDVPLRSLSNV